MGKIDRHLISNLYYLLTMKEFALFFKRDLQMKENQPSPEQLQQTIKPWQDWLGSIAAQNKLTNKGNRLTPEIKIVKPNNTVLNGPFAEIKEAIGGFIVVKAADFEEALEMAKGCPVLL